MDPARGKLEEGWEVLQHWQIEGKRDKRGRPDDLRLVDPQGVVHKVKSWPARNDDNVVYAWRMNLAQAQPFPLVHEIL